MSKTTFTLRGTALPVLLAAALTLLTGCEGVGDGSRPDPSTAKIEKFGNSVSKTKLYSCFPENAVLTVRFTGDGGLDNFTNRVKWTSSNRDVLVVSNAGDRIPGESDLRFNGSGQLLPLKPGTATITATGLGINTSVEYTVVDPTNLRVRAVDYATEDATSIVLAPRTRQDLQLLADFDGFTHDQTGAASWSFVNPNPEIANFIQSGEVGTRTIQTKAAGDQTLRAVPKLFGCGNSPLLQDIGIDVRVAPAEGLSLERELADAPNRSGDVTTLVVGTSELLRVYAQHRDANGDLVRTQDVSGQVLAELSPTGVLVSGFGGVASFLSAFSTGTNNPQVSEPVEVNFCLPAPPTEGSSTPTCDSDPRLRSATLQFRTRNDTLQSFALAPNPASMPALGSVQLRATGTYVSGHEQDVTRHVSWRSSDTTQALVNTSGRATSLKPQAGQVTVTAENVNATAATTQTLTLNIVCPEGAGEACAPAPAP